MIVGNQFGYKNMISGFDIFKSIGGGGDFDGRGFGRSSLIQPKMDMTLTISWFDISFVVGKFEIGNREINGNFVGNDVLVFGGGGDSQRRICGKDSGENQGRYEHCF